MNTNLEKKIQITAKDLSILQAFDLNLHSHTHIRHFKDCLFYAIYLKMKAEGDHLADDALDLCYQMYGFFSDVEKINEKYSVIGNFIDANTDTQNEMIAYLERSVNNEK